jgi:hypothetical protein
LVEIILRQISKTQADMIHRRLLELTCVMDVDMRRPS